VTTYTCKYCAKTSLLVKGSGVCLSCYLAKKDEANDVKPARVMRHSEDDIQIAFIRTAKVMFPKLGKLLYHACNEGKRNPRRSKAIGIESGVADIHLAIPNKNYHSLYIEFKSGKNKQTPEQIEFQKQVTSVGNHYVVCYSAVEAIDILREYLTATSYK